VVNDDAKHLQKVISSGTMPCVTDNTMVAKEAYSTLPIIPTLDILLLLFVSMKNLKDGLKNAQNYHSKTHS